MKKFVQFGFGRLKKDRYWFDLLKSTNSHGRYVIPNGARAEDIKAIVNEIHLWGTESNIFVLAGWDYVTGREVIGDMSTHIDTISDREGDKPRVEEVTAIAKQLKYELSSRGMSDYYIEVGPEVNLDKAYRSDYKLLTDTVHAVQGQFDEDIIIGPSISDMRSKSRKHLDAIYTKLHSRIILNFHPYRMADPPARGSELDEIVKYVQAFDRRMVITEMGWHDAKAVWYEPWFPWGWFKCKRRENQFTLLDVALFCVKEWEIWVDAGVELFTWFQIRDGLPSDTYFEAHFGLFKADGTLKPVGEIYSLLRGV